MEDMEMRQLRSQCERNNRDNELYEERNRWAKGIGYCEDSVKSSDWIIAVRGCLMVITDVFYTQECESHFMHFIFDN